MRQARTWESARLPDLDPSPAQGLRGNGGGAGLRPPSEVQRGEGPPKGRRVSVGCG